MLPSVRKVENIELIRDGGSLAATFESDGGSRYILFLEIRLDDRARSNRKMARYDQPVLIDCDPTKRPPNTKRILYSELGGPRDSISWNQARVLLEEISKLARLTNPLHSGWLKNMVDVASSDGIPG
jgi:hypothetical protein